MTNFSMQTKAQPSLNVIIFFTIIYFIALGNHLTAQVTDFKPSGNLWGYVFGDYYFKAHSDTLGRAPAGSPYGSKSLNAKNQNQNDMNAFQIRRAYIGYDYTLSSRFSAQAVLANEMNIDGNGYNTTYLKYAWLKCTNIFQGSNLMIGQMPTSSFATPYGTEPLWGYRSVEKTLMDLHSLDPSTDMGIMLIGNVWQRKTNSDSLPATIGYSAMIANGTGAKPDVTRFKKMRGNIYLNTLHQKLTFGVYGDYYTTQLSPYQISNATLKGYMHFKTDWFRVGAEVFQQLNKNGDIYTTASTAKADTANGMQLGWSVFLSGRLIKNKLNYYLRMDKYNPDTKYNINNIYLSSTAGGNMSTTTFYTQTFYLIGFDYTPVSRIHIMPNLWYTQYNTMMSSDPLTGKELPGRARSDYDLVPRITFFFVFNNSPGMTNNGMDN